jgi:hypothetical protein
MPRALVTCKNLLGLMLMYDRLDLRILWWWWVFWVQKFPREALVPQLRFLLRGHLA